MEKPRPEELGTLKTVEEKLDCVLNYYHENKIHNDKEWQFIGEKVGGLYLNEIDFYLVENGYIIKRENRPFRSVTIKGELFNGFVKEKRKEIISKALQLSMTVAIVIGTFGLLIWEMIKYFLLENHETINYYYSIF